MSHFLIPLQPPFMSSVSPSLVFNSARLHVVTAEKDESERYVALALEGNPRAEEALFRLHAPMVYRTVSRLLGQRRDTEDLVHDTFIDAFAGLHRLRNAKAFEPWLRSIAIAKVRQHCRKQKWHHLFGFLPEAHDASSERPFAPHVSTEMRAELSKVYGILDTLAVNVKLAWLLRHVEEYELQEIADTLKCSLATTKRHIQKAEEALSVVLNQKGGGR